MTGHEAKIRRAERKSRELEQLRAEVPERVQAGISWAQEQGVPQTSDREGIGRIINLLTELLDKDVEKMRRELEKLRRAKK
jgi:hypothetical protein